MKKALMILAALSITGCSPDAPAGHWEGKGRVFDEQMHDAARTLTRKATTEFWFTIRPDGSVAGEIELIYDAQLTVALPSVEVPAGSFSPTVSGKIADADPSRRFPLAGVYEGGELVLQIAVPEDQRAKLDFIIEADPGVSIQMPGGIQTGRSMRSTVTHLPMKPFSPFTMKGAPVTKSFGRHGALYEEKGERYGITWSARKVEDLTPRTAPSSAEIDAAVQSIRAALKR